MWLLSVCFLGCSELPKRCSPNPDPCLLLAVFVFLTQSIELLLLFSGNGSTAECIFSSGGFCIYNTFLPGSVSSMSETR